MRGLPKGAQKDSPVRALMAKCNNQGFQVGPHPGYEGQSSTGQSLTVPRPKGFGEAGRELDHLLEDVGLTTWCYSNWGRYFGALREQFEAAVDEVEDRLHGADSPRQTAHQHPERGAVGEPAARLDGDDPRRTHADIRELNYLHVGDGWEVRLGLAKVFWGVTESGHLVDIINQDDSIEDVDGEDKLGQPMVNLATHQDWGSLNLFVMPWFRERTFPGKDGRLRFPLVTDGDPDYDASNDQQHIDVALRYSHYVGAWDFGVYYFNGSGREPRFLVNDNGTRLVPFYDLIEQVGTDVQLTHEGWLWKFEGLWRSQNSDHFWATVGGFEYTLYQIVDSSADLGLLLEYSWDGRDSNPAEAPPVLFDDDFFMGTRLTLNDVQDSELLVGVIVDRDTGATQLWLEAERRLTNQWNLELESRWFTNAGDSGLITTFKDDSHITLRLSRYF